MVELATRPGYAAVTDLPRGECAARIVDGRLWVDRADPRVLISAELLARMEQDPADWYAWVDVSRCAPGPSFVGAVVKIEAANRKVVYRIVEYVGAVHGYIGQWPD